MEKTYRYRCDKTHTYRQQLADFITAGKWSLMNYFTFVIVAVVNGQPHGHVDGNVTGENLGYCAICGTEIMHHYTVTDKISKRSVNIGCECIQKIFGEQNGQMISRAVQSLQNKVKSNYMRPFKHTLLSSWLAKIAKTDADDIRGQQIISEYIDYFEEQKVIYASRATQSNPKAVENNLSELQRAIKSLDEQLDETLERLIERSGEGPFSYWSYHAYMFSSHDWNPDHMRTQYKNQAEKYDTELPPKWSEIKLMEEKKKELNQKIVDATNKYIEELKKKMDGEK